MNLELLDPFGRQIPDRVDATLDLPAPLHFSRQQEASHPAPKPKSKNPDSGDPDDPPPPPTSKKNAKVVPQTFKAAYYAAYNRRGTYLAVGYASGAVAVFNTLTRTLAGLYRNEDPAISPTNLGRGITSVSWSRRSRTMLAGAAGDATVCLFDTTHPQAAEESCYGIVSEDPGFLDDETDSKAEKGSASSGPIPPVHDSYSTKGTSFCDTDERFIYVKERKALVELSVRMGEDVPGHNFREDEVPPTAQGIQRHYGVTFDFPHPIGASLQVHPRIPTGGLAVLAKGILVLFYIHPSCWMTDEEYEISPAILIPIWERDTPLVTCAAFDPTGNAIYAGTKDGTILGFDVSGVWRALTATPSTQARPIPTVAPRFHIPPSSSSSSSAAAWHLLVGRNGKFLVVNCADGALRLYTTAELWNPPLVPSSWAKASHSAPSKVVDNQKLDIKPTWIFQDIVSKVKFISCDLSGDGEYLVGGCHGDDNKYELHIWNTSTGMLMDKLTGSTVRMHSVSYHPTRSFLAVTTSDGLVDIWGPRINWTSFAPDFSALPKNVEYNEREDEFDVDEKGQGTALREHPAGPEREESPVNVLTVGPVPVFASDSEEETAVFEFDVRVKNILIGRTKAGRPANPDD